MEKIDSADEPIQSLIHRKSMIFVFVPFSQNSYTSAMVKLLNKCDSKLMEIILINTEEFISEIECEKILQNTSIESRFIMGTKISNWDYFKLFLENTNANVFMIDRAGNTHKYKMNSESDCDEIMKAIKQVTEIKKIPHTVQELETLSSISLKYYGTEARWEDIYKANRDQIRDPILIYPGQVLYIPLP